MKRLEPRANDHVRVVKGAYVGKEGKYLGSIVGGDYFIELIAPHTDIWIPRSYFLLAEEGMEPISFWRFFRQFVTSPHPLQEEHIFD